jgi:GTP pyrophosphokinase
MVSLDRELKNGDVVEIIKNKKNKPSLDWIHTAKTAQAKKLIKAWFKNNDPTVAIISGRNMLNKALAEIETSFEKLGREKINLILKTFSCKNIDALFARIGMGDLEAGDIIRHAFDQERQKKSKARPAVTYRSAKLPDNNKVIIDGQTGFLYKLGRCCNPDSGNKIKGFITRSRGVTIHLESCPNIKKADRDRSLEASWT